MNFLSIDFVMFLSITILFYLLIPIKLRNALLALSSILFIGIISPTFMLYALLFSIVNYFIGRRLNVVTKQKRTLYYLGQCFNIGGLVVFKYLDFLLVNLQPVFDISILNELSNSIIIPIGISYYTFQGVSYLYLIYKVGDPSEKNLLNFLTYMLFFPKVLAGPIERHRTFLPQLRKGLNVSYDDISIGLRLILWGALKKVLLGDTLGVIITKVHSYLDVYDGVIYVVVMLLQPLSLYGDFSGYTDMAIGVARLFGIKLSPNFNRPFLAQNVGQFWKRWHISLSSWCNDYIYNRLMMKYRKKGNVAVLIAIFWTFLLIGIWHGPKWTFVVLGLIQVIALTFEFYTKRWRKRLFSHLNPFLGTWISRGILFVYTGFFLTFFFADNLTDAITFLSKLSFEFDYYAFNISKVEIIIAFLFTIIVFGVELCEENGICLLSFQKWPYFLKFNFYILSILAITYFSKNSFLFTYAEF